jgi:hypothetical protein
MNGEGMVGAGLCFGRGAATECGPAPAVGLPAGQQQAPKDERNLDDTPFGLKNEFALALPRPSLATRRRDKRSEE